VKDVATDKTKDSTADKTKDAAADKTKDSADKDKNKEKEKEKETSASSEKKEESGEKKEVEPTFELLSNPARVMKAQVRHHCSLYVLYDAAELIALSVASLGYLSPWAATGGVTPVFP